MHHITAPDLAAWINDPARPKPMLLDVREPWEYEKCHIDGANLMPMQTIPEHINDLDDEQEIVCICHHGARSAAVAAFLEKHDFTHVTNLTGGIHAWAVHVDPTMTTY
ncbi:MAG: rhodanese-like domain-containing protein [Glaciimonas sp.]|nr:rhodanese-like domain-containing protein [Glaciimonas sp.]